LDATVLQHRGAVADGSGEAEVLLGQQDCDAVLLELTQRAGDLFDDDGARPSLGSSSRIRRGLPISVRAMVSICCSPPLIWLPRRERMGARLGKSANRRSGVQGATPAGAGRRPTSRFSRTVRSAKMRRSSGT